MWQNYTFERRISDGTPVVFGGQKSIDGTHEHVLVSRSAPMRSPVSFHARP